MLRERTFAIVRILGNENPPRDMPGSRLASLKFILENEPDFPDTYKIFIVNRIVDPELSRQIWELLRAYRKDYYLYHNVPVPWTYLRTRHAQGNLSDDDLNLQVIGINTVRNAAVALGLHYASNCVVLDGDCIFDYSGWDHYVQATRDEPTDYYSIPSVRMSPARYGKVDNLNLGEPMVAFTKASSEQFNPELLFGKNDKLELLFRLGHDTAEHTRHLPVTGNRTQLVGHVCHLQTGSDAVESDVMVRMRSREESLKNLWSAVRTRLAVLPG
jgi:hypothetical protein